MRRTLLASSTVLLALACTPPKKSASDSSGQPQPQNPDTGNINVDTDPEDGQEVDDSPKLQTDDLGGDDQTVGMAGKLAISTGLTEVAKPDQVLAFPIRGGELKSIQEIIRAKIDADGKFSIKLPKFDPMLTMLVKLIKNDKVDRDGLKKWLAESGHGGEQTKEFLAKSDSQLLKELKDEIAKSKSQSSSFVVVSMVSSNKPEGRAKRAEEAATFAFIGFSAGGGNLFNIPVAAAKKGAFELGTITISGDDAKSAVNAGDGKNFEFDPDSLAQMAATGATLKAIKNDYVNLDPKTSEGYHASPFFLFEGDVVDVNSDGFTKLDLGYKLKTPVASHIGYSGYGLYMRGRGKDPNHPDTDLVMKNLCADDLREFAFYPPLAIDAAVGASTVTFDPTHPMGNGTVGAVEEINNHTRVQCSSGMSNDLWYASGNTATDRELNWNWGSGGALQGSIPAGAWHLKIEGTDSGIFDLAAAQPLSPLGEDDLVANVFVPQIKVSKDGLGFITGVDVRFAYFDAGAATPAYRIVTNLAALRKGVQELAVEFDDYNGTREGNRIGLSELPDADGVFSADPSQGQSPAPMLFPAATGQVDTDRVADSISVTYKMYGNSYRFDYRLRGS